MERIVLLGLVGWNWLLSRPKSPYEPEGREFESLRARHLPCNRSFATLRISPRGSRRVNASNAQGARQPFSLESESRTRSRDRTWSGRKLLCPQ